MELKDVLSRRHSIRRYTEDELSEADLNQILEAARGAPSAGNLQAYQIVVVRDGKTRGELAAAALGQSFIADAPVALVFLSEPMVSARRYGDRGKQLYAIQDATIAAAYAQLRAVDLGYGSVWVGAFDTAAVAGVIKAPHGQIPVAILPIGRAGEQPNPTPRRKLSEFVRYL